MKYQHLSYTVTSPAMLVLDSIAGFLDESDTETSIDQLCNYTMLCWQQLIRYKNKCNYYLVTVSCLGGTRVIITLAGITLVVTSKLTRWTQLNASDAHREATLGFSHPPLLGNSAFSLAPFHVSCFPWLALSWLYQTQPHNALPSISARFS